MECKSCKHINPEGAIFCNKCGNIISREPIAMTIGEAADTIGCRTQTILNLIDRGVITMMGSGDHRRTYVSRASVMKFCNVLPDFADKFAELETVRCEMLADERKLKERLAESNSRNLVYSVLVKDGIFRRIVKIALNKREAEIVEGVMLDGKTIETVADECLLTQNRTRDILEKALTKLDDRCWKYGEKYSELLKKYIKLEERNKAIEQTLIANGILEPSLSLPISELGFNIRTEQALLHNSFTDLLQLTKLRRNQIEGRPRIGYKEMAEIERMMELYNLEFKPSPLFDNNIEYDEDEDEDEEEIIYDETENEVIPPKKQRRCNLNASNSAEEWRNKSVGYNWAKEKLEEGWPARDIVDQFNRMHETHPEDFSTRSGNKISVAILCLWKKQMFPDLGEENQSIKDAREWRRSSPGYQWVKDQIHNNIPLDAILTEFNHRHLDDKGFSTRDGGKLSAGTLLKWRLEILEKRYE